MVHSPSSLRGAIGRLARVALSPLPPRAPLAAKGAPTAVQCRHGRRHLLLLLLLDAGHFNLPARAGQCAEVTAAAPTLQGAAQAQQLVALLAPLPLAALHLQAALVALVRLRLLRKLAQLHSLRHRSMPMAGDRGPSARVLCACRWRQRACRAFLRRGHAAAATRTEPLPPVSLNSATTSASAPPAGAELDRRTTRAASARPPALGAELARGTGKADCSKSGILPRR